MLTAATPASAAEPARTLRFEAEVGAHPINGRGANWTAPTDDIEAGGATADVLTVDGVAADFSDDIWIQLRNADGKKLRRGVYRTDAANRPDGPRMLVVSRGLGCVDDHATFTITHLRRDANGRVSALDLRFEHRCGSPTAPSLRGRLHFRR